MSDVLTSNVTFIQYWFRMYALLLLMYCSFCRFYDVCTLFLLLFNAAIECNQSMIISQLLLSVTTVDAYNLFLILILIIHKSIFSKPIKHVQQKYCNTVRGKITVFRHFTVKFLKLAEK